MPVTVTEPNLSAPPSERIMVYTDPMLSVAQFDTWIDRQREQGRLPSMEHVDAAVGNNLHYQFDLPVKRDSYLRDAFCGFGPGVNPGGVKAPTTSAATLPPMTFTPQATSPASPKGSTTKTPAVPPATTVAKADPTDDMTEAQWARLWHQFTLDFPREVFSIGGETVPTVADVVPTLQDFLVQSLPKAKLRAASKWAAAAAEDPHNDDILSSQMMLRDSSGKSVYGDETSSYSFGGHRSRRGHSYGGSGYDSDSGYSTSSSRSSSGGYGSVRSRAAGDGCREETCRSMTAATSMIPRISVFGGFTPMSILSAIVSTFAGSTSYTSTTAAAPETTLPNATNNSRTTPIPKGLGRTPHHSRHHHHRMDLLIDRVVRTVILLSQQSALAFPYIVFGKLYADVLQGLTVLPVSHLDPDADSRCRIEIEVGPPPCTVAQQSAPSYARKDEPKSKTDKKKKKTSKKPTNQNSPAAGVTDGKEEDSPPCSESFCKVNHGDEKEDHPAAADDGEDAASTAAATSEGDMMSSRSSMTGCSSKSSNVPSDDDDDDDGPPPTIPSQNVAIIRGKYVDLNDRTAVLMVKKCFRLVRMPDCGEPETLTPTSASAAEDSSASPPLSARKKPAGPPTRPAKKDVHGVTTEFYIDASLAVDLFGEDDEHVYLSWRLWR